MSTLSPRPINTPLVRDEHARSLRHNHALKRRGARGTACGARRGAAHSRARVLSRGGRETMQLRQVVAQHKSATVNTSLRARVVRRAAQVPAASGASRSQRAEHVPVPLARRGPSPCRIRRRCRMAPSRPAPAVPPSSLLSASSPSPLLTRSPSLPPPPPLDLPLRAGAVPLRTRRCGPTRE